MGELLVGAASALWLGILTSLSPCPLATNIAAISFISRRVAAPRLVFLSGLLYVLGRTLVYVALGVVAVAGLLSIPQLSHILQKYMNKALGPILILVGMVLLELLRPPSVGGVAGRKLQPRIEALGVWGAAVLGMVFALSFCPVSAALFFGGLIPMAVGLGSSLVLPLLFGIGTGLPVLVLAILIATGARHVGRAFERLTRIEWWARRVTGVIFIVVGLYYSLAHIFGVFS